jgi:hypothetical protein
MRGLLWCGLFCCCLLVAGTAAAQQFDPQSELLGGGEPKIGGRLAQEPNQTAQATPSHDYRRLTLKLKPRG